MNNTETTQDLMNVLLALFLTFHRSKFALFTTSANRNLYLPQRFEYQIIANGKMEDISRRWFICVQYYIAEYFP